MADAEKYVKDLIASDKIVIFSKSYCPYCDIAKEVFDKLGEKYTAIELDQRDDCAQLQDALAKLTGNRTVPRVYLAGICIGGGVDVKCLYDCDKLQPLVNKLCK